MKQRCLMLGAGGMAGAWIRHFFPPFRDRVEIVALVDVQPEPLESSGNFLGLPKNARFRSAADAFARVEADFCTIVIPPAFHKNAVMLAAGRKMDILSEKPIADTWEASVEILRAVRTAGVRMQVVQNYRFTPRILTVGKAIREGRIGKVNYLVSRFLADYRKRNAWGKFRHEIPHTLLVEGGIHHLDQLRNLAGADCKTISGLEWRPPQQSFDGEPCGLYVMQFANKVCGTYEGNCLGAGWQNSWHQEYYRAEGEDGAIVLDNDNVVRVQKHRPGSPLSVEELTPEAPQYDGHLAILDQFLTWKEGGPPPPTVVEDNIKSVAMLFGAIRASETGAAVSVDAMAADALAQD